MCKEPINGESAILPRNQVDVKIAEVKRILGEKVPIYSPGVGTQGGAAETAVKAGANYLIVGREITQAIDPAQMASQLCDSVKGI